MSLLNKSLELKKTFFHYLHLYEIPNIEAIEKLIYSDLINYTDKEDLKKYLLKMKDNKYEAIYINKKKYGRITPIGKCAISFKRIIRHTIFNDIMTDIDIVNAGFTMLHQICKKNNIDCKYLSIYIDRREEILKEICEAYRYSDRDIDISRDDAKELIIMLAGGGKIDSWKETYSISMRRKKDPLFVSKFEKEITLIADYIVENNKNLIKEIKKDKTEKDKDLSNIKGSTISQFLQTCELRVLEIVYNYCINNGYIKNNICSLCHDGIMIETVNFKDELLSELNKEVKKKTGFNLKFIVKEMDSNCWYQIKDIEIPLNKKVENEADGAEIIYSMIKDNFKCCYICKTHMLFYKYDNIWTNNENFIKIKLANLIREFGLYIMKEVKKGKDDYDFEPEAFGRNQREIQNIISILFNIAKDNIDNAFYDKLHTSNKGKLCFRDGVLDIEQNKFYLWDDEELIKNPVYSVVCINRDFNMIYNNKTDDNINQYKLEVKNIIESIMGDQTDKCLQYLSRAVFGYINDKDFAVFMGNRDCGKGVLTEIIKNSLTSDYMGTIDGNFFLCQRDSKKDDGRALMSIIDFQFKRLMITHEIQFDSNNKDIKLNGVLLKSLFSGGDTMKSRENYGNFMEFNIQSKLLLNCNDLPKSSNKDIYEKLIEFNTTSQFKTADEIQLEKDKIESEINDIKNKNEELEIDDDEEHFEFLRSKINKFKLADEKIKDKIKMNENWKNAFILLMVEYWKDEKLKRDNKFNDEEEESLTDVIYRYCLFKKNKDYQITNNELKNISDISGCSMKKLKVELCSMGGIDFRTSNERGIKYFKLKDEFKNTSNLDE